jgi:hypothetical protein
MTDNTDTYKTINKKQQHVSNNELKTNDISDNIIEIINDFTLDELHTNLIIISKIASYNKLLIQNRLLSIDPTPYIVQSFSRYMNGEDRYKSISFIKQVFEQTFKEIKNISQNNNYSNNFFENQNLILQRFNTELQNSINGLNNLKVTYNHDETTKASIDVLIKNITNITSNITNSLSVKK